MVEQIISFEATKVSAEKTASEIEDMLRKAGVDKVGKSFESGHIKAIYFQMDTPEGSHPFMLPVNVAAVYQILVAKRKQSPRYRCSELPKDIQQSINDQSEKTAWQAIQTELSGYSFNVVFESPILSNLVFERHHACSRLQLRPMSFRKAKLPEFGGLEHYELQGHFSEIGWHDVSWVKCLNPPCYLDEVRQHLRARIQPLIQEYRGLSCEMCGSNDRLEVDHESPPFKAIAKSATGLFTEDEIEQWAYHDWVNNRRFTLPDNHPVVVRFLELHSTATLRTLCQPCHSRYGAR